MAFYEIPPELLAEVSRTFWPKVAKAKGDGCWLWTAARLGPNGYGQFHIAGRAVTAHRVGYMLQLGAIPRGASVCHHCDKTLCVRGDHLFLGSHVENMADMKAKGRSRGSRPYPLNPRLSSDDLKRCRKAMGLSQTRLAEVLGVDTSTVRAWEQGSSGVPPYLHLALMGLRVELDAS